MEGKNNDLQKRWMAIIYFPRFILGDCNFFNNFFIKLGNCIDFYLKNGGDFYFDFFKESAYSLSKAVPGGSVLGSGLWIKAWLQQRKEKSEPSE